MNLWLHLISLSLWIGGIAFFLIAFGPAVRSLPAADGIRLLNRGRQSLQTLSWIAISLVFITGVLNLFFRGMASGLDMGPGYTLILSVKLLLFFAMVFHHSLQTFKYAPKIIAGTSQIGGDIQSWPEPLLVDWGRWFMLLKINAALGAVVLLLGLGLSGR